MVIHQDRFTNHDRHILLHVPRNNKPLRNWSLQRSTLALWCWHGKHDHQHDRHMHVLRAQQWSRDAAEPSSWNRQPSLLRHSSLTCAFPRLLPVHSNLRHVDMQLLLPGQVRSRPTCDGVRILLYFGLFARITFLGLG